ncbi:hypothetical protein KUTeg_012739 [Tegillarca granosa]|uniref:TIR domain-containing protein n=1 Tax=Tegillarca granosa TaxID=220873 RepID=A0ABQ9F0L6_TEGGR|nr:hypothetical protein KUTeg_012739 [Tegillarca granosa]
MAEANSGYPESGDSWLEEAQDAEVLIIYDPDDKLRIEKYILQYLKKKNIKYVIPDYHIIHDGIEIESITNAIYRCKKTLIILSQSSSSKIPVSLEMILALEKSMKTNRMSLMLLMMDGISEDDIPKIPVMLNASRIKLVDNIHERCLDELVEKLRADVDLTVALPAGNFSSGMVWSHFLGYLKNILPGLPTAICDDCKWFNPDNVEERGRMPVCFFMLLPASGRAPTDINHEDENIRQVGHVQILCGKRPFQPNVYEVTDPEDGSKYYCCAEYPGAFCCLGAICDLGICNMSPQQRHLEVERFIYQMEGILNHKENPQFRGLAKLLPYNDENKNSQTSLPSYHLLRAIKGELHKATPIVERLLQTQISRINELQTDFKFHVCLVYDTETDSDKNLAEKLRRVLEEKGVRCCQARSQDPPKEIENRIRESRWIPMFISQSSLKSTHWLQLWLAELLSLSASEGQLRVLPLLVDVQSSDIPDFIRWVTYIDVQKEPNFCDRVLQIITGESITLESQVPVGNVAFGLAWSFEVNYLHHFLPEIERLLNEKLKTLQVDFDNSVCLSGVLYEIIPKSCQCQSSLAASDKDNIIKEVASLKYKKLVHGTQRLFHSTIYLLKGDDDKDYYFVGEYASPVKTLYNMNQSMIAGLNNEQLVKQVREFKELSEAIQNCQDAPEKRRNKCKFVYFDDTKRSLSSVLYEKLKGKEDKGIQNYWKQRKNAEPDQRK